MSSQPLVSVVTPVHNGEAYLGECIESVLAQTYQNWDYTIVDNCSTDRSREVALRYAEKDCRIRVVTTDRLLDVMKSQNTAFRQLSPEAEYCKMLHADDWMFSNCLEQMVALGEDHPSVGVIGSYRLDGVWVELDGLPFPSTVVPGQRLCRSMLGGGPRVFGSPSALLYRARYVRQRPEFFDEADFHADVAACFTGAVPALQYDGYESRAADGTTFITTAIDLADQTNAPTMYLLDVGQPCASVINTAKLGLHAFKLVRPAATRR